MITSFKLKAIFTSKIGAMPDIPHQIIAFSACIAIIIGLVFSRSLISIGVITLFCNTLLNRQLQQHALRFSKHKAFIAISLIFLLYFISGLWSDDVGHWYHKTKMKLPFLVLPLAFCSIPPLSKKAYQVFLYLFFWAVTLSSCWSMSQYLLNIELITEDYHQGHVLPTLGNHIHFSLMLAYAILIGAWLTKAQFSLIEVIRDAWKKGRKGEKTWTANHRSHQQITWWITMERYLLLGITLFLLCFIHILAVRSGLLALYVAIGVLMISYVYQRKGWRWTLLGLVGLILGGSLAIQYSPTLNKKYKYTKYSVEKWWSGEQAIDHSSDSKRIASIVTGIHLGNSHFLYGVGVGDTKQAMQTAYGQRKGYELLQNSDLLPHNQWVYQYAATGLIGLMVFLYATIYPLVWRKAYRQPLFLAFHLIIFTSFLVECTLERQVGTTFCCFFLVLGVSYWGRNGSE